MNLYEVELYARQRQREMLQEGERLQRLRYVLPRRTRWQGRLFWHLGNLLTQSGQRLRRASGITVVGFGSNNAGDRLAH